jgi:hypothetical protein
MADGNMAEGIDDMMMGENMVRRDEFFLQLTDISHRVSSAACVSLKYLRPPFGFRGSVTCFHTGFKRR